MLTPRNLVSSLSLAQFLSPRIGGIWMGLKYGQDQYFSAKIVGLL